MNYLGIDRDIFLNGLNKEIEEMVRKAISLKMLVYLIDSNDSEKKESFVGRLEVKNGKISEI